MGQYDKTSQALPGAPQPRHPYLPASVAHFVQTGVETLTLRGPFFVRLIMQVSVCPLSSCGVRHFMQRPHITCLTPAFR